MYRRFPLTHKVIHGEFGAIECLNLKYALTLIETNVLKFMSSLYVILFYKFVCNNKLIIYLSMSFVL
jgi:hypothetical protein